MSDSSLDVRLRELLDRSEISDVLVRYCRACDRQDIGLMREAFHSDATISQGYYIGPASGFFERFDRLGDPATSPITRLQHRLSNVLCQLNADVADVESYFQVCRRRRVTQTDVVDETICARALDRFERRAGRWAIARREVIWDWAATWPAQPAFWELEPGDYMTGRRDDEDPSIRIFPKKRR